MNTQTLTIQLLKGLDERQPTTNDHPSVLENWRTHKDGGWINNLGYEKYFTNLQTYFPFQTTKIDSLFYYQKSDGTLDTIIYEQGGVLSQLTGIPNTYQKTISSNRTIPNPTEIGTQYCQFSKFLIYSNGFEPARKLVGKFITNHSSDTDVVTYPLGFFNAPSTPVVYGIETDPAVSSGRSDKTSIWFLTSPRGLGSRTSGDKNRYKWKVSFINNAGCESPLSDASAELVWTTPSQAYAFAVAVTIPIGDSDIVARRIYRTQNLEGDATEYYYYVADLLNNTETLYFDDNTDFSLGAQAPDDSSSVIMPSRKPRFVGTYKSCVFVDGGFDEDTTIYWSNPSRPDQFALLDFIDVRNTEGGSITGFYAYFGFMLVFREKAIDLLSGSYPNFQVTNLVQYVGTKSINTVTSIPNVGIIFLGNDGVYILTGNPEYGVPQIQKMSVTIQATIDRINFDCAARASAAYSHKWREWICFVPIDGAVENTIGIVYHLDNKQWSIRKQFPAGPVITNQQGDIIFGYHKDATGLGQRGLWVMSARHTLGSELLDTEPVTVEDQFGLISRIKSQWIDFGDPSIKKKIVSVYLIVRTKGDNNVTLKGYKDYQYNTTTTTKARVSQISDVIKQSVYDKVLLDDNKYWEETLLTTLRFDVDIRQCSYFQWEIETQKEFAIIGYFIDYQMSNQRILEGRSS